MLRVERDSVLERRVRCRPLICHKPVIPGLTLRTFAWWTPYFASSMSPSIRGPDQAHVAHQHVEELRQLVEARLAQKPSNGCDAWVVGDLEVGGVLGAQLRVVVHPLVRVLHHRAKLQHAERAAVEAGDRPPVEHGPRDVSLTNNAITKNSGDSNTTSAIETIKSMSRLDEGRLGWRSPAEGESSVQRLR